MSNTNPCTDKQEGENQCEADQNPNVIDDVLNEWAHDVR